MASLRTKHIASRLGCDESIIYHVLTPSKLLPNRAVPPRTKAGQAQEARRRFWRDRLQNITKKYLTMAVGQLRKSVLELPAMADRTV
jgi:hypothetical protein